MLAGASMVTIARTSLRILETRVGARDLSLFFKLCFFRHVYYYNYRERRNSVTQEQNSLRELHLWLALI